MKTGFVIAIDGPAASGKGTIVQLLTVYLHGINIYTGGMYRALALACLRSNVDFSDSSGVLATLKNSHIELGEEDTLGVVAKILLHGEDVTETIRTPDVAIGAGKVTLIPGVREELVNRQRAIVKSLITKGKTVIIDGQDAGINVYPNAEVKIFLTASQEERARRRGRQYEKQGLHKSEQDMLAEIKNRDERDFGRKLFPLSCDPKRDGYEIVDSTNLTEDETLHSILEVIRAKNLI